jgi:multicomponent Na+:H+ antiporter subunit B
MKESQDFGMTLIVKTVTRLTVGLILLYGLYVVTHGHLTPGGGFVGGIVIALSFIHLTLAFGREGSPGKVSKHSAEIFEGVGALMFVMIALAGFLGGSFFLNLLPKGEHFALLSAGTIPLSNIAICLKVGAGMFSVFLALALFRFDWEKSS